MSPAMLDMMMEEYSKGQRARQRGKDVRLLDRCSESS